MPDGVNGERKWKVSLHFLSRLIRIPELIPECGGSDLKAVTLKGQ
ncbi:hypothetical protein SDC9_136758 [bioreactor metagenome]|uniref:Uncharacterized protein n=1 Tax=bioreactor metagenome TaxID=1076179 RepID=A0A645DK18_9ZZZZ